MKMTDFSYQLYSSRKFGPLEATLEMVEKFGYKQVQAYGGLYEDLPRLEKALANKNLTMPPKSTWFDPKPLDGLVVYEFEKVYE